MDVLCSSPRCTEDDPQTKIEFPKSNKRADVDNWVSFSKHNGEDEEDGEQSGIDLPFSRYSLSP